MKYRLIKSYPDCPYVLGYVKDCGDTISDAYCKQFPEFWKELEPGFKVGDWICVTDTPDIHPQWKGWVDKITSISGGNIDTTGMNKYCAGLAFVRSNYKFRLATKEEIERAEGLKIAGYRVKFGDHVTAIGCEEHSNASWTDLSNIMYEFSLGAIIHSGGAKVTYDEIKSLTSKIIGEDR